MCCLVVMGLGCVQCSWCLCWYLTFSHISKVATSLLVPSTEMVTSSLGDPSRPKTSPAGTCPSPCHHRPAASPLSCGLNEGFPVTRLHRSRCRAVVVSWGPVVSWFYLRPHCLPLGSLHVCPGGMPFGLVMETVGTREALMTMLGATLLNQQ